MVKALIVVVPRVFVRSRDLSSHACTVCTLGKQRPLARGLRNMQIRCAGINALVHSSTGGELGGAHYANSERRSFRMGFLIGSLLFKNFLGFFFFLARNVDK